MKREEDLRGELESALAECSRLREENARLRARLQSLGRVAEPEGEERLRPVSPVTGEAPPEAKIALFRRLFRGREDLYAVRWETKSGRSGYSPVCANEWRRPRCRKPRVKCGECGNAKFPPLTDSVIRDHLSGRHTVAVYPLLPDETCRFLAIRFEGDVWKEDVSAFQETGGALGIPGAVERLRSGTGAHVWVFFEGPVPAPLARNLGCAALTAMIEKGHVIDLGVYDRISPDEEAVPRGGFGGLVPLPLQRGPREEGNTVFLDPDFRPHPDPWAFLSSLERMSADAVRAAVRKAEQEGGIVRVRLSSTREEGERDPWTVPASESRQPELPEGPLPEEIRIVQASGITLERDGLPAAAVARLIRLAAFQNPEYYRAQAMRMSTFDKPRIIACAQVSPDRIRLPRGCLEEVVGMFEDRGVRTEIVDRRKAGLPIEAAFSGSLTPLQQEAARALLAHENGVLHAGTAFGKTVVAAWMIAARKVNTLVLVHRRQLMDQWQERLTSFLDAPPGSVGRIGGGANSRTGRIDIAVLQSLIRKGEIRDLVAGYGHVIVDECHHVPAFTFEQVLNRVEARFLLGLTATPIRKDGHHPIVMMQCGPIRFRVQARSQAASRPFDHVVIPRRTGFRVPRERSRAGIQAVYAAMIADSRRNEMIFRDLMQAVREGRSPLLLSERTGHVEALAERLAGLVRHVVVLRGGMSKSRRREVAERIRAIPEEEDRVLIATGRYIGEGFDDARLDTLFLTMPVSWRGTLQQYAGRLHRLHENKTVVRIYDYVDGHVPMLMRMYERRLAGYRSIGYSVQGIPSKKGADGCETS